ncbi:CLUMA_CG017306, isoform A [Clunio marinus]|uniref:CLUMA_CG017306, isoform A n=1 Tax=Clunio marinus TaxID=568069 RepID=A0A1J1IVL7_9DIPT|nr:CLUMA_CG017306, isoform A [Clunio marinus]
MQQKLIRMSDLQNLDRAFKKIEEYHKNPSDIDDDLKNEFLLELRKFENSSNVEEKFLEALTTQEDSDDEEITGKHESGRGSHNFKLFVNCFKLFRGSIEYSYRPPPQAIAAESVKQISNKEQPSKDDSAQNSSKDVSKQMEKK